jgi:TetR/AcrR family transcriptional regulator, cholesterol catabolism regulator
MARERKNRKADIIRCFGDMVAERGYDNVSLRDVAEALDMSKGTILHHFGSKDRLLEHVHSDYMERRLVEAHSLLDQLDSPRDQLAALIYQLMLAEHHDRSSTVAFAREIVRFASEDMMSDVRRMRDEYSGLLRGVVQRGMDEGMFAEGNAAIVTLQIFGMCNWSWTWYRPEGAWSAEDIAETFIRVIFNGLRRSRPLQPAARVPDVVRDTMRSLEDSQRSAAAASAGSSR